MRKAVAFQKHIHEAHRCSESDGSYLAATGGGAGSGPGQSWSGSEAQRGLTGCPQRHWWAESILG